MARLSGIAQPAGLGKTATGLGGKGLGKSTAKRHQYGLIVTAKWATLLMYDRILARQHSWYHQRKHSVGK